MPKPSRSMKTTRKTISRLPRDGAGKGMVSTHEGETDKRPEGAVAGRKKEVFRGQGEFATHDRSSKACMQHQIRRLLDASDVARSLASIGLSLYPSQFTICG